MLPILSHSARTAGLNNSSRAALSRVSGRGIIPPASALAARRGLQPHSSLASGQQQQQQQHSSNRTSALAAIAGCVLGSAALVSASAEEEKHEALFTPQQVQIISIVGPPLCGKATHAQRIGKYFDALCLGPEDDIFSEVALGTAGGSQFRTCILGWPRSAREAQWIEEELCPLTALVYIDVSPQNALRRTNERAASAVKSGHKLFHAISDDLLEAYQKKGKLIVVDGNQSLEDTWKEVERKLAEALKKGS